MAPIVFVMGSDSDLPSLESGFTTLKELGVPFTVRVLSAHRTPTETLRFAESAESEGVELIIAASGMAAHLAGVLASNSSLPVIGIPIASSALGGVDSLYSTVQMPPGVPVATMGIGKAGAKNAALFAVRILALRDEELRGRLKDFISAQAQVVRDKDARIRQEYSDG